MVKFGHTITYVDNVEQVLSFFEKTFDMKRRFLTDENDYAEPNIGETLLAFASH